MYNLIGNQDFYLPEFFPLAKIVAVSLSFFAKKRACFLKVFLDRFSVTLNSSALEDK